MSRRKSITPSNLAKEFELEVDDVLLKCWDIGLDSINDPNHFIPKRKVPILKRHLGLTTKGELTSVEYWTKKLKLSQVDFTAYCLDLGINISPNARKLPKGALKKLRSKVDKVESLKEKSTKSKNNKDKRSLDSFEDDFEIPTIGKVSKVYFLTAEAIKEIHFCLVKDFAKSPDPIEPSGIKNANLFESAITRPMTGFGEEFKYPTVELAAGALLHSIIHNHPFHNGNKRTALVSMLVMLEKNNMLLLANETETFKYILQIARHGIIPKDSSFYADREVASLAWWIKENSRGIEVGDRIISWRRLERILKDYGCNIQNSTSGGVKMTIERKVESKKFGLFKRSEKTYKTKISINNSCDIQRGTVKKVRRELGLTEEDGVDSHDFYSKGSESIDTFINRYRKTLNRLAKL